MRIGTLAQLDFSVGGSKTSKPKGGVKSPSKVLLHPHKSILH